MLAGITARPAARLSGTAKRRLETRPPAAAWGGGGGGASSGGGAGGSLANASTEASHSRQQAAHVARRPSGSSPKAEDSSSGVSAKLPISMVDQTPLFRRARVNVLLAALGPSTESRMNLRGGEKPARSVPSVISWSSSGSGAAKSSSNWPS